MRDSQNNPDWGEIAFFACIAIIFMCSAATSIWG